MRLPTSVWEPIYSAVPIMVTVYGFLNQYADFLQSQDLKTYADIETQEFDFIIVGAGSAGSVLANRLTANGQYTVLLIEKGGNPNPVQKVPFYFPTIFHTKTVDLNYYTVPQKNACLALKEQRSYWPRGTGLGGSSNLNAMYYQRGHKSDYDRWATLTGNNEWKFDNLLNNFKNIEDYHSLYPNKKWHSSNGNGVYVSASTIKKLLPEFLEAGKEMGYPTGDLNGLQQAAFSHLDVTIKQGRRFGAYDAFIEPVIHRKNLHILRYARVLKVKLDKRKRAYGVIYLRHGLKRFVKATKEVILAAGAIDSPKLLMLSGIGPQRHLRQIGIRPILDLPVGQNLMDHIFPTLGPFMLNTTGTSVKIGRDLDLHNFTGYWRDGSGILSTPLTHNGIAYIYSKYAKAYMKFHNIPPENVAPDLQLTFMPMSSAMTHSFEKGRNLKKGILKKYLAKSINHESFFIHVMLGKPKSRGNLKLASRNPFDDPLLDPKYLSHPDDVKILADGLNFTVYMVENTNAFQQHGARLIDRHFPGCEQYPLRSLKYYECFARQMTNTVYHPSGTCSMGKESHDPKAVVDAKLRVIGTIGLRVVDGSIFPEIPNCNINAAVYMVADKASEIILSSA